MAGNKDRLREKKRHRLALIYRLMSHLRISERSPNLTPRSKSIGSVKIYRMVRRCPGGRHAWFDSSAGLIRKPL